MASIVLDRPTAAMPSRFTSSSTENKPMFDPLREQFRALADWWHEATDALSSPSQKVKHSAYQRIIWLREGALPFILEDLRDRGGYWFYALEQITGLSPLPKEKPASFATVKEAWLKWGRDKGMI